jgi:hypothetical protein
MNSFEIKHALLSYFRYKRQCICATECLDNDVMVITKKGITLDIEIKVNKYDLWKGEAKKSKHKGYKRDGYMRYCANKFYICVPTELLDEARKWVETINNKYGIIECSKTVLYPRHILIIKKASMLHKFKNERLANKIMMRVCSENIGLITDRLVNRKED